MYSNHDLFRRHIKILNCVAKIRLVGLWISHISIKITLDNHISTYSLECPSICLHPHPPPPPPPHCKSVREQYYFFFVRPSVRRDECILVCFKIMDTSVYFSGICSVDTQADWFVCRNYVQSTLVCLIFDTQGYFVRKETQKYTSVKMSVRASLVRSFVCHTISLTTEWNLTKPATSLPLLVRVYESNIIFSVYPSVCAFVVRPSVRHVISS